MSDRIQEKVYFKWSIFIYTSLFYFFLPLYTLATNGVPLVSDLAHQVIQFLGVCGQLGLVPHGLSRPHCGVVNWLLGPQRFLELLKGKKTKQELCDFN